MNIKIGDSNGEKYSEDVKLVCKKTFGEFIENKIYFASEFIFSATKTSNFGHAQCYFVYDTDEKNFFGPGRWFAIIGNLYEYSHNLSTYKPMFSDYSEVFFTLAEWREQQINSILYDNM